MCATCGTISTAQHSTAAEGPAQCDVALQIRVFCRLRPSSSSAITALSDGVSVSTHLPDGKEAKYSYDRVFDASTQQETVFNEVSELIQSALDGYQVRK